MTRLKLEDGQTIVIMYEQEFDNLFDNVEMWGRKDIAKYLGISVNRLSECPWLLVGFGKGLKHKRNIKWPRKACIDWLKKGPTKLKEEYLGCN